MIAIRKQKCAMLLVIGMLFSPSGANTASLDALIDDAARFEQWEVVLKLAKQTQFEKYDDAAGLIKVIRSCAALACDYQTLEKTLALSSTGMREFANIWNGIVRGYPKDVWTRLNALTDRPESSLLGIYGLLEYAIETENFQKLEAALKKTLLHSNYPEQIKSKIAHAKATVAAVSHNYSELDQILDKEGHLLSREALLDFRVALLSWKNSFAQASNVIQEEYRRFGVSHNVADTEVDLLTYWKTPSAVLKRIAALQDAHPRYWRLPIARIMLLEQLGRISQSERNVKASKQNPKALGEFDLLLLNALVHTSDRARKQALNDVNELQARFSDYPYFHTMMSYVFFKNGKTRESLQQLELAEQLTPGYPPAALLRALIAIDLSEFTTALRTLESLISLDPNDIDLRIYRAQVLILTRRYSDALAEIEYVKKSPRYVPKDVVASLVRDIRKLDRR